MTFRQQIEAMESRRYAHAAKQACMLAKELAPDRVSPEIRYLADASEDDIAARRAAQ